MVEDLDDRYEGQGQVISGKERQVSDTLMDALKLSHIGILGEFTWQNYSRGCLLEKHV